MAGWEGMESVKDSLEDTRLLLCGGGGGGGEGKGGRGRGRGRQEREGGSSLFFFLYQNSYFDPL